MYKYILSLFLSELFLFEFYAQNKIVFKKPNISSSSLAWDNAKSIHTAGGVMYNLDKLWEHTTLPIGNGSIGANIYGAIETERITFNEKTLWRGGPNTLKGPEYYWNVNKKSAHVLDDIRKAFSDGDIKMAEKLTMNNFNSSVQYKADAEEPFRFGSFTTCGEFRIQTGLDDTSVIDYSRVLSIDSAYVNVSFISDGIRYTRNYFTSYPDNVMIVRFLASEKAKQNLIFSYIPNPLSLGKFIKKKNDEFCYSAKLENNNMEYAVRVKSIVKGGKTWTDINGCIHVDSADEVLFLIAADTDYKINFNPDFSDPKTYVGVKPLKTTNSWIKSASASDYDTLLKRHYEDYSSLFNRVEFTLNDRYSNPELDDMSTPERLARYRTGAPDYGLETLYYQFGRYLLISSSRPGNLPANLQGIWHNNVDGPWRVDYHNNINLQMNYWPACPTNLSECEIPLIDFIRSLMKPGAVTAKSYFGARGWTTSVSSNIFGFTTPLSDKNMSWNFSPVAGPWLATHVWNYYDYTRDINFLKITGYQIIKESAMFAVDYLWHKSDGTYTAAPSTSPEHGPIDEGATFSHAVIREILICAIEASKVLDIDVDERRKWEDVLANIVPYKVGRYGQLMEWSKDIDDPYDRHRHVNHLFGLHPGHTISPIITPELAQASRTALEHRGDGATGWSMGWKLNQWARLHDGNRSYTLYSNLLKNGTNDNLWDSHPPFQIDGNFGGTAGVTEMLMQSHMGFIHLLPALPDVWHDGRITGIRAKGNFTVDLYWSDNNLTKAVIHSGSGVPCRLYYKGKKIKFETERGQVYNIEYYNGMFEIKNINSD